MWGHCLFVFSGCSSSHWSSSWECFLPPAATSCPRRGGTSWAVRWVQNEVQIDHLLTGLWLQTCLFFQHRIPPSSTSILTTSPSISTARNTPGRVSQSVVQHSFLLICNTKTHFLFVSWDLSRLYLNFMLNAVLCFWRCGLVALCGWTAAESGVGWRLPQPHNRGRWANTLFVFLCWFDYSLTQTWSIKCK